MAPRPGDHGMPDEVKRRGFAEVRRVLKQAGRFVAVDFGATPEEGFGHILCILGLRTGWDHAERLREMLREAAFDAVGPTGHRGLAFVRGRKPARSRPDRPDIIGRVGNEGTGAEDAAL